MTDSFNNPEPAMARIRHIVDTVPGWTPDDQLSALYVLTLATAQLGGDVLEIGSWCGRSTAVLGHAVRDAGAGHVFAVDLFPGRHDWRTHADGTHSFSVNIDGKTIEGFQNQTVWDEPFQRDIAPLYDRYDGVLDAFRATIAAEALSEQVTAFRGTAQMFASKAPKDLRLRLAFLDGDHSYDAVCADIDIVERYLQRGGFITFDDAFSVYGGVDAAIRDRIIASGRYDCARQLCRKFFVARLR